MGGAVSAGLDNDDLIDNLIKAKYIRTPLIEKVFRCVDRAFYFLPEFKRSAYRDLAWKHGKLHLSAPCIYSEVMEQLDLMPGLSFLNIGSGTGYLSTMVGLILGTHGINHGIEIYSEVVEYANEKLELFKKICNGIDVFELCEPHFIVGNGFNINPDRKYDRIYCGAACPEAYHEYIKQFLKVGGILVMPCEDDLLKIIRSSDNTWEIKPVLPVSFSTLQLPEKISNFVLNLDANPLGLQALCRMKIRSTLRTTAEKEIPDLNQESKRKLLLVNSKKKKIENHVVIPIFENIPSNETNSINGDQNGRLNFGRLLFHNYSAVSFRSFIRELTRDDDTNEDSDVSDDDIRRFDVTNNRFENQLVDRKTPNVDDFTNSLQVDDNNTTSKNSRNFEMLSAYSIHSNNGCNNLNSCEQKKRISECDNLNLESKKNVNLEKLRCINKERDVPLHVINVNDDEKKNDIDDNISLNNQVSEISNNKKICNVSCKSTPGRNAQKLIKNSQAKCDLEKNKICRKHEFSSSSETEPVKKLMTTTTNNDIDTAKIVLEKTIKLEVEKKDYKEELINIQPKKLLKREKLDSGISEENDDGKISTGSNESSYSESMFSEPMEIESENSEFTYDSSSNETNETDSDYEKEEYLPHSTPENNKESIISMKYRMIMENKIQTLPLPQAIKLYLNYNREFIFV